MSRQSISLTEPNDEWLKAQVASKEYSSKSEVINDLIRQERRKNAEMDYIKAKIKRAKASGLTTDTIEEILQAAKARFNG
ncbi:ribbon-helix-helix domain-containing protein [Nonlabens sp.]|uniref:ribbon-helix-helix domain-containing protein n=1 Tax=Nonlabens sp. TaxID=1888209 RepID=UPI003F6982BF